MYAHVEKLGNAFAIRIPEDIAARLGIADDTRVELRLNGGKIEMTPKPSRRFTLENLVGNITDENRHDETDFGPPVGGEEC